MSKIWGTRPLIMKNYRYGSHNIFDIRLHLVWVTKYRYPVLTNKIGLRVRELIRQICESYEINILSGAISSDHVHVYLSVPPQIAPSKVVMRLKGRTSHKIQQEFPELRKRYWGQHFWARGYFCVSGGSVTDQMITEYLENHHKKHINEITVHEEQI